MNKIIILSFVIVGTIHCSLWNNNYKSEFFGEVIISPNAWNASNHVLCNGKLWNSSYVCGGVVGGCIAQDICSCNTGVTGRSGEWCDIFTCFGVNNTNGNACNGNGVCWKPDKCACKGNYYGTQCQNKLDLPEFKNGVLKSFNDTNLFGLDGEVVTNVWTDQRVFHSQTVNKMCVQFINNTVECRGEGLVFNVTSDIIGLHDGNIKQMLLLSNPYDLLWLLENGTAYWAVAFGDIATTKTYGQISGIWDNLVPLQGEAGILTRGNEWHFYSNAQATDAIYRLVAFTPEENFMLGNASEIPNINTYSEKPGYLEAYYNTDFDVFEQDYIGEANWVVIKSYNRLSIMRTVTDNSLNQIEIGDRDWMTTVSYEVSVQGVARHLVVHGMARIGETVQYCNTTVVVWNQGFIEGTNVTVIDGPCVPMSNFVKKNSLRYLSYGESWQEGNTTGTYGEGNLEKETLFLDTFSNGSTAISVKDGFILFNVTCGSDCAPRLKSITSKSDGLVFVEYDVCKDPGFNCNGRGTNACVDGGDAICVDCIFGYDGQECEKNVFCDVTPCLNGGNCTGIEGGRTCDCSATIFEGDSCETPRVTCNGKQIDDPTVCNSKGTCVEQTGQCACAFGSYGNDCEEEYCWSTLPREYYEILRNLGFTNMTICTYATIEGSNVVKLVVDGAESGFTGQPIGELVKLVELNTLSIKNVKLDQQILQSLPTLTNLKTLELVETGLSGSLDWLDFPQLETLILSDNEFNGEIDPQLFEEKTPVVVTIKLNNNLFTGTVPNIPDTTTEFDGSGTQFDDVPPKWGEGQDNLTCIIELEDLCGDLYDVREALFKKCCTNTIDIVEDNVRAEEAQQTVTTVAGVATAGVVAATIVTTAVTTGATSIGGLVSATASSMGSIGGSGSAMAGSAGGANPGMAQVVGFAGFVGGVIGPLSQKNSQGSVAGASDVARPFATGTINWGVKTPESAENSCTDGVVINRNFITNFMSAVGFATEGEVKANKDLDGLRKFAKRANIPDELMFVTTMASYAVLNAAIIGLFLILALYLYCKSKDSITMKSLMYKSFGIVVTILSYAFYALVLLAFWELGSDRCITVPGFIILAIIAVALIGCFFIYVVLPIKNFPKDEYRKLVRYDEWLTPEFVAEQQRKEVLNVKLGIKKSDVHHTILHILYEDYRYESRLFWLVTFTHKVVTAILVIFGRELSQVIGLVAVQMVLLIAMVYFKPYTTKSMSTGYYFVEISKVFILLSTIAFTESADLSKEDAKSWGYITLIGIVITLIGYMLILIGIAYSAYKTKKSEKLIRTESKTEPIKMDDGNEAVQI